MTSFSPIPPQNGGTGVSNSNLIALIGGDITINVPSSGTYMFPAPGSSLATTAQVIQKVNVTSSTQTLDANTQYLSNNGASLITYSLPATANVGDEYFILGYSSGGWTVSAGGGQSILMGPFTSTIGLSSTVQTDSVWIICTVANTTFIALPTMGEITSL